MHGSVLHVRVRGAGHQRHIGRLGRFAVICAAFRAPGSPFSVSVDGGKQVACSEVSPHGVRSLTVLTHSARASERTYYGVERGGVKEAETYKNMALPADIRAATLLRGTIVIRTKYW